jgi:hypothetical protein
MIVIRKRKPMRGEAADPRCQAVPSQERIRELCGKIREAWTPREQVRRAGLARAVALRVMPLEPRRKGFE